ncbi:hypothetical protein [Bordetella pertussis]|uniref:hypothetical protein n=1 Tax=Bordetella pertussis TaxID=520 RepID=UPI0010769775|nr:hypothetical protein [Bordetella pertussis]QBV79737.1 hypothetical protein C5F02_13350 [Bordetella pertussis]QBW15636.1 hypothetical protein C5E92_13350 [Bordetella pertussis]
MPPFKFTVPALAALLATWPLAHAGAVHDYPSAVIEAYHIGQLHTGSTPFVCARFHPEGQASPQALRIACAVQRYGKARRHFDEHVARIITCHAANRPTSLRVESDVWTDPQIYRLFSRAEILSIAPCGAGGLLP